MRVSRDLRRVPGTALVRVPPWSSVAIEVEGENLSNSTLQAAPAVYRWRWAGLVASWVAGAYLLKRLAWLDLSDVQHRFVPGADASHTAIWDLSMEYRRFVLLRLAYPELEIPAPPLIDSYWRLHAADQDRFTSDCESLTQGTDVGPDELVPPPRPAERIAGPELRELYETTFPYGDAELWGWPQLRPGHRNSAAALGSVLRRLPSAIDESTRTRLREEAVEKRRHATESQGASTGVDSRGRPGHDHHPGRLSRGQRG